MAIQDFFQDVHNASRPISGLIDLPSQARTTTRDQNSYMVFHYLQPVIVNRFQPADFSRFGKERQQRLQDAVAAFRDATSNGYMDVDIPVAKARFDDMHSQVSELVRDDWLQSLERVVRDAEEWSARKGWLTKRIPKKMKESTVGEYAASRLLIYADGLHVELNPVARFALGTLGLVDIAKVPITTDAIWLIREESKWVMKISREDSPHVPEIEWNEAGFLQVMEILGLEP